MEWIIEHSIPILELCYETKSCRINYHGRTYGCPIRQHNGKWYFSFDDRCVWYIINSITKEGDAE